MATPNLIDVTEVLDAIVAGLKAIPELLAALDTDGEAGIQKYGSNEATARNPTEAIDSMLVPSALLFFNGLVIASRGSVPAWKYSFSLAVKTATQEEAFALAKILIDGVPDGGSGLRWLDEPIHPSFDPPEFDGFIPYRDKDANDFWQFNFSLYAIGG